MRRTGFRENFSMGGTRSGRSGGMADAPDSKSGWGKPQCGFESRLRYSETRSLKGLAGFFVPPPSR